MAELKNLIDLIRTVNEVYFITAPKRVRAAYILVDDIVELSLKTFLYQHTLSQREQCTADFQAASLLTNRRKRTALQSYFEGRIELNELASTLNITVQAARQRLALYKHTTEQKANAKAEFTQNGLLPTLVEEQAFDDFFAGTIDLTNFASALSETEYEISNQLKPYGNLHHWSVNEPNRHATFYTIITDAQALFPANSRERDLLDVLFDRHDGRNLLYHSHHHTAWSIENEQCLQAMCDLFELMETLFPDFNDALKNAGDKTVACQIGVLRLKLKSEEGQTELVGPYRNALKQLQREHVYDQEDRSVEHSILHNVSADFFRSLRTEYGSAIAELEVRVNQLQEMMQDPRRRRREHPGELTLKSQRLDTYRTQLSEIEALLGTP